MARTESKWQERQGGYIETANPSGFNVLINGVDRYVNFGSVSGILGYGFRDNGGTMEFKNLAGDWTAFGAGGGSGDVTGPASSIDNAIVRYDGTTGKIIQGYTSNSPTISDTGLIRTSGGFQANYIQGILSTGLPLYPRATTDTTAIQFFGSDGVSTFVERATLLANGKLGLGMTTPVAKLEVSETLDTFTGLGDSANYHFGVRHNVNTNGIGVGYVFNVTTTQNNAGAAIIHRRTGANSQGVLEFYTKTSTAGGVAPILALTLNNDQTATFTQAVSGVINPYGAGWNGSAKFATEDAVYDKIEALGGAVLQVFNEVPTGSINSSNTVFTTAVPFEVDSTRVYLNGIRQTLGSDYTETDVDEITFTVAPTTSDVLIVDYQEA
jgi:hypothetical protein